MYDNIKNELINIEYGIEKSKKTNEYTYYLIQNNVNKYMLSKYTPRENLCKTFEANMHRYNKETTWILFGFNFGYIIQYIQANITKNAKIIVIEPQEELLKKQLEVINESKTISYENVSLFTGIEFEQFNNIVKQKVGYIDICNIEIICTPEYMNTYLYYSQRIMNIISGCMLNIQININTVDKFKEKMIENVLENRYNIANQHNIRLHRDGYKNIPAVIVSAGPSLKKNIEYLREFKGIIFVCGRTITPVLDQGVRPDFLVSLDPQDVIFETLDKNKVNDIPLITMCVSNPKVVEANKGPQYFVNNSQLAKELLAVEDILEIVNGGSVATLCLSSAYYMGCDPIIFIGQDLAFTNMQAHAYNHVSYEVEKDCQIYKEIAGYYNDKVLSSPGLISFLSWIEDFISSHSDRHYINATEGGAHIKGTEQKSFKEVVQQYEHIDKPRIKHNKEDGFKKVDIDVHVAKNLVKLKEIQEWAVKGKTIAIKLKEEYATYKGIRENKIVKLVNQLDEIDKEIFEKAKAKAIIECIFNSNYLDAYSTKHYTEKIGEKEIEKGIRIGELSELVYDTLIHSITQIEKIILDIKKEA